MAVTSQIKMDPAEMEAKAGDFETKRDEFNDVVLAMDSMVSELCDVWDGSSSQAFFDQFDGLKPGFQATYDLITDIATQLREISSAMMSIDEEIANKMRG